MTTLDAFILTGKSNWMLLPDPVSGYSLITAGQVIEQPLGKAQCVETGLIRRIVDSSQVSGDYYETGYAGYYDRPGSEHLNLGRYDAISGWMADALEGTKPNTILDIGCGAGVTIEAIAKAFPDASIAGIEPSRLGQGPRPEGDDGATCRDRRIDDPL
jgi:hypothetical protein